MGNMFIVINFNNLLLDGATQINIILSCYIIIILLLYYVILHYIVLCCIVSHRIAWYYITSYHLSS